ncbi:AAA family ATPase [Pseudomonas peli]|uniref:AAA family ATPase n=1 Tax=Pseudomonas peli TaxID=592361 RepID=UPI0028633A0F|nr:AAA family ATPase [Pseudomonas peli]MDR7024694.1 hypothetical protein [Pseudomonas peli]
MGFVIRPKISDVFTPRTRAVNDDMYVSRALLESELEESIDGHMHTMLFGESGNGKSWLYKHVFSKNKTKYVVANCGNALRLGSLTEEIYKVCIPTGSLNNTVLEESKEAKANAIVAEGTLGATRSYDVQTDEPLLAAFKCVGNKKTNTVIVIENLEMLVGNEQLVDELCSIILLLDDERYALYKIKLLIVGTPNGVGEFFGVSKNLRSISNRLEEISKVSGLDQEQIKWIIEKGFIRKLKIELDYDDIDKLKRVVFHYTLGIAQCVQEYCAQIAKQVQINDWNYEEDLLKDASANWLRKSMRAVYSVIESHLNSKETTVGRRNQVIYAIGKINKSPLQPSEIEAVIRKEFSDTVPETNMGIGSILGELCSAETPILRRNEKAVFYSVVDPLYIMCIRLVLFKSKTTGKVERRRFKTG